MRWLGAQTAFDQSKTAGLRLPFFVLLVDSSLTIAYRRIRSRLSEVRLMAAGLPTRDCLSVDAIDHFTISLFTDPLIDPS